MNTSKSFAIVRIVFGLVWAVDAYLKWLPGFFTNYLSYYTGALPSQPALEQAWLNLWIMIITPHQFFFALATAIIQTLIAVSLIFGIYTRTWIVVGAVMSFLIWTLPEGLGGPYMSGATDISAALIYVFLFITLWLGRCWKDYSIDSYLARKFPTLPIW